MIRNVLTQVIISAYRREANTNYMILPCRLMTLQVSRKKKIVTQIVDRPPAQRHFKVYRCENSRDIFLFSNVFFPTDALTARAY